MSVQRFSYNAKLKRLFGICNVFNEFICDFYAKDWVLML